MDRSTKDRILDAAERLFAENGFATTSLRQITTEAGVNLASVNYHFGSKDALLEAVFERRLGPLNRERLRELDRIEAEAGGGPLDLEAVVRAFFGPALRMRYELSETADRFMQLVGRSHSDPDSHVHSIFLRMFRGVLDRFLPAYERALPDLPRGEIFLRFHFIIGAMAHTLAWSRTFKGIYGGYHHSLGVEDLVERLVGFAVAGLRAPVPAAKGAREQ